MHCIRPSETSARCRTSAWSVADDLGAQDDAPARPQQAERQHAGLADSHFARIHVAGAIALRGRQPHAALAGDHERARVLHGVLNRQRGHVDRLPDALLRAGEHHIERAVA